MPHNHEWQTRIKAVEREYGAIRQATRRFLEEARRDPTIIERELRLRDVDRASDTLAGTYVIRLFAEFETGLRSYWDRHRRTNPRTRDLLDALAAMRGIPDDRRDDAHAVREYRNSLLHERESEVKVVGVDEARRHLCFYFSFLPPEW